MPKRDAADPADASLGSVLPADHPPLAFPQEDWAWFTARCNALGIPHAGLQRAALEALYGHLVGVNRWLNLTKLVAPREYLKQHVLDSLSLIGDARLKHLSEGAACADLGSGGGYPGLPLALWYPTVPWCLIDARKKKVEFLAAAGALAHTFGARRVTAHHLRGAEAVRDPVLKRACQLVVSRAMAAAAEVLAEAEPLLEKSGHVVIFKGPAYPGDEEQQALAACKRLGFRAVSQRWVQLEDGDPERVQVVFQKIV
jgi:16S rRNA (guanine527-N7)-methyltransferase